MLLRLKQFSQTQKVFVWISIFFALFLVKVAFHNFLNNSIFQLFQLVSGLFFMILGTGISVGLILQWVLKKPFDKWEFLSLSLLAGMLIPPVILTAEFFLLRKVYDWLPFANSLVLWILAGFLLFYKKTAFPLVIFSFRSILKHPLFIVLATGAIFTFIQINFYHTLPDLDPYKWLMKYDYQFPNQQLDYIERPLFGSLIFILTRFTGLSTFHFFKYVFPFLFLLTLFPAWMISATFAEKRKRWIFLLFSFISPAALLYGQTPMPQSALIVLTYFFVFFLLYADEKSEKLFFYAAGASAFLFFFFHQAGIILFAVWGIVAIIKNRAFFFEDKKVLFFSIALVLTNLPRLKPIYSFGLSWTERIILSFFSPNNLNLLYPAYYTNVDLASMGWGSFTGVIKFYAFHAGPLVLGILILSLGLLFFKQKFRGFLKNRIQGSGFRVLAFLFLLFFFIAEVFPRFPNVALLPDRAWIFAGIFSFIFTFAVLRFVRSVPLWAMAVFIFLLTTVAGGALYVNYLKRYLITPGQWTSAQWIKKNLPENRIFLSYGHKSLLPIHAQSPLIRIPSQTYCSDSLENFQDALSPKDSNGNPISPKSPLGPDFESFLESSRSTLETASKNYFDNTVESNRKLLDALNTTNELSEETDTIQKFLTNKIGVPIIYPPSEAPPITISIPVENVYQKDKILSVALIKEHPLYIYYARQSKLNPYRIRPYEIQTWGVDPCPNGRFLFDLYPDKFKRTYSTKDEEIIIWKVL